MTASDFFIKLCLQGCEASGKTALLNRFLENRFVEEYVPTRGLDVPRHKLVSLDGKDVKLQLWDIPGGNLWRESNKHHRGTQGFMVVFDLTDPEGLSSAQEELHDIKRYASDDSQRLLVGTRCDNVAKRVINYDTARAFAQQNSLVYIETSALQDINVNEAFFLLGCLSMLKLQQTPAGWEELQPLVPTFSSAVAKLMSASGLPPLERCNSSERLPTRGPSPARSDSPSRTQSAVLLSSSASPPSALRPRRNSRIRSLFSSKAKEKPLAVVEPAPEPASVSLFLKGLLANLQFDHFVTLCALAASLKGDFLSDELGGDIYMAMKRNSNLTALECIGGPMKGLGLMKIGDLLRINQAIRSVVLQANGPFDKSSFEMFCNAFKRGHITELSITQNVLPPPLVDVLAGSAGLRNIVALTITHAKLEDKSFSNLAAGLHSCIHLQRLDVSDNLLRVDGAKTLASLLIVLKHSLRIVEVARNQLDDEGLVHICTALYHSRVESLDMDENYFTVEGCTPLARVLRNHLNLRVVCFGVTSAPPAVSSLVSTYMRAALRRNTLIHTLSDNPTTRGCRPFIDRNQAGSFALDMHVGSLVELAALALLQHAFLYEPAVLRSFITNGEFAVNHLAVIDPLRALVEYGFPADLERKKLVAILRYHYLNNRNSCANTLSQCELLARLRHSGVPRDLEAGLKKLQRQHPEFGTDELLMSLEEAAGDVSIASTNLRGRAMNTIRKLKPAKV